jgi:heme-degrading monooxygenase HmoA
MWILQMKRFDVETHYWIGGVVDFTLSQVRKPFRRETLTMFARKVAARLKPDSLTEFANVMEREILPWLRKQAGFLDLITLATPDGTEVAVISFWDQEGDAQAFNSEGYPEALKLLGQLLDGIPYVKTFDVVSSTFQTVSFARRPGAESVVREADSAKRAYRSRETGAGAEFGPRLPVLHNAAAAPMGVAGDHECNRQLLTSDCRHRS